MPLNAMTLFSLKFFVNNFINDFWVRFSLGFLHYLTNKPTNQFWVTFDFIYLRWVFFYNLAYYFFNKTAEFLSNTFCFKITS